MMTGESVTVGKRVVAVAHDSELRERASTAFPGMLVTRGDGTGRTIATGGSSEISKIGRMLRDVRTVCTPLSRQIERLGPRHSHRWQAQGDDPALACPTAVDNLVRREASFFVNSGFLRASAMTLTELLASHALPIAIALVVALQFLSTHVPPAPFPFGTAAMAPADRMPTSLPGSSVFASVGGIETLLLRRGERSQPAIEVLAA